MHVAMASQADYDGIQPAGSPYALHVTMGIYHCLPLIVKATTSSVHVIAAWLPTTKTILRLFHLLGF